MRTTMAMVAALYVIGMAPVSVSSLPAGREQFLIYRGVLSVLHQFVQQLNTADMFMRERVPSHRIARSVVVSDRIYSKGDQVIIVVRWHEVIKDLANGTVLYQKGKEVNFTIQRKSGVDSMLFIVQILVCVPCAPKRSEERRV